jgi:putative membrane protein
MQMPTSLDQEHQRQLQDLKTAMQFEQKFRTNQIQAHEKAIKLFQDYAQTGDNADLKSWAQASVATLQKHLQKAEGLTKPTGTM